MDRTLLVGLFVLVVGAGLAWQGGLFSTLSTPEYDIDGDECSETGSDGFTCSSQNRPGGDYDRGLTGVIGEEEGFELDENGALSVLRENNVVVDDSDGQGVEFNAGAWEGVCTVTAGFESNENIIEVQYDSRFDSSVPIGCSLSPPPIEEVKITRCGVEPFNGMTKRESCEEQLTGTAYGEYLSVDYQIKEDTDDDGVFDDNDACPNVAGRLENGCRNTPPEIDSLDIPEKVEDESSFQVSVSASDVEGQELSYEWSNGDTDSQTSYSFAQSGQEKNITVKVSDGLNSTTGSQAVEVLDSLEGGAETEPSNGETGSSSSGPLGEVSSGGIIAAAVLVLMIAGAYFTQ